MVMMATPLADAVKAIRSNLLAQGITAGPVVMLSPSGRRLDQDWLEEKLTHPVNPASAITSAINQQITPQMTLVCGRYEGVDQRFINRYVTEELSLGDFVMSGGEIAALAVLDSLVRRLPGVMQDELSSVQESFLTGRLEHPHYTRPEVFEGEGVPELLLSGHHGKIEGWREEQSLCQTKRRRPDLLMAPSKKP
jgi:tRNA (guanine37-N1)-methyltransferase